MEKGKLFVVDYPIYHDIPHVPDITDEDPTDRRVMLRSSSPVGLFAVRKDSTGKNELKAVAIQLDYKPGNIFHFNWIAYVLSDGFWDMVLFTPNRD